MNAAIATRSEFFSGTLINRKVTVLRALDKVLGNQACTKREKIAALREIEDTAKRMADQIERYATQGSEA